MNIRYITAIVVFLSLFVGVWGQSANQNYINVRVHMNNSGGTYLDNIAYYDGLGRPVQVVQKGITPAGDDLATLTEYDGMGREYRQWLPVPFTSTGDFVNSASFTSAAIGYYSDSNPYAETLYEPSPLNRTTGQKAQGTAWHSQPTDISYQTNTAGEVARYVVNGIGQLQRSGSYAAGTLYKTVVKDEDGNPATEYKDKLGQVVMTRQASNYDTYYVYNDLGQLSYVLPPLAADGLNSLGIILDDNSMLIKYAYVYKYDNRGNQTYKRLPGCEPVYMSYDKAGRLILSQDGNQRPSDQWMLYKYDVLGRLLYTSKATLSYTYNQCIDEVKDMVIVEKFAIDAVSTAGYSKNHFQSQPNEFYIVNYYDNYDFLELLPPAIETELTYVNNSGYGEQYDNSKGLLTGTRVYLLDDSGDYLTTAYYYDDRGQIIQTRATNYLDGYDILYNAYDFVGNITQSLKEHTTSFSGLVTEFYAYTYDHAGRLEETTYQLDVNPAIILAQNGYDELGRLTSKKRHNWTDNETFDYNIRNWITKIQSGGSFEQNLYYNTTNPTGSTPYFNGNISYSTWDYKGVTAGYQYSYDQLNRLVDAFSTDMAHSVDGMFDEQFSYDKHGNILTLYRMGNGTSIDDLVFDNYNGNQLTKITDMAVNTSVYTIKEYADISTAATEFYYDANGNMTADLDRNIVTIQYNVLNLPDLVQFGNGHQIVNKYTAGGQKLETKYATAVSALGVPIAMGNTVNSDGPDFTRYGTIYNGNIEYAFDNGYTTDLERIHNAEGYVDSSTGDYNYYRRDHLGNNREVWNASMSTTIQWTQYYPSGLPWEYITGDGDDVQPYKFGGKEFVETHGLDEFDFHARGMYPAIMRFNMIDPLAEKYYSISPYAYCANNPINRIDKDGRDWDLILDHDKVHITIRADFITFSDNLQTLQAAAEAWNAQSGKFSYIVGEGNDAISYSINFDISVNVGGNIADNIVSVRPDDSKEFAERRTENSDGSVTITKPQGGSDGRDIIIKNSQKDNINITSHEMGHNLGMDHSKGLMRSVAGGKNLSKQSVVETLGHSGVGNGAKGKSTNAKVKSQTIIGNQPDNFQNGKIKRNNDWEKRKFE